MMPLAEIVPQMSGRKVYTRNDHSGYLLQLPVPLENGSDMGHLCLQPLLGLCESFPSPQGVEVGGSCSERLGDPGALNSLRNTH